MDTSSPPHPKTDHSPERAADGGRQSSAAISVAELFANPATPLSEWSISQKLANELEVYLRRVRPSRILEVGSGFSTAVLASYAVRHGASLVTLEHEEKYYARTAAGLALLGLDGPVDLRLTPLRPQRFGSRGPYQWYDVSLDGTFDFVFVDGPPLVVGRLGVFFAVRDHLAHGWQLWLDDGRRDHEEKCIKVWKSYFPDEFVRYRLDIDSKGVLILRDARQEAILSKIGIGVLGAGGPDWWELVKRHVGKGLLDSSYVVVMTRDSASVSMPKFVDKSLALNGQGVRPMFDELGGRPDVEYMLYLDDQWSPSTLDGRWLRRALGILQQKSDVDQVSLRRIDEIGETTGQAFSKPFAHEPSLLRASSLKLAMPPEGGVTARRRILRRSGISPAPLLQTEQLFPGVFRRITGPPCGPDGRA